MLRLWHAGLRHRAQERPASAHHAEEGPDVLDEQVGRLHRGEVAAPVELRPVHDLVLAFGDPTDRRVAGEDGDAGAARLEYSAAPPQLCWFSL